MRWLPLIVLMACVDAPKGLGVECSRTSQCDTPLVCRLQACRTECRDARDCPHDSVCLVDDDGLGACRLIDEATCAADEECPAPTTCIEGACHNECLGDDCTSVECVNDDECMAGQSCIDGRCLSECVSDRDCRFGAVCNAGRCTLNDGGADDVPALDASPDGGPDAGVSFLAGVSSVGAGPTFSCAVSMGRVLCWGGFAWEGVPPPLSYPPLDMGTAGARVVARPMARHFCVISDTGALSCAGGNLTGVVGDGTTVTRERPVPVVGLDAEVTDVAVGNRHVCAIASGNVFCWGTGMLGDGRSMVTETEPIDIGLAGAADVSAGSDQTCAVMSDGRLLCWGDNDDGRAGLGAMAEATTPTDTGIGFTATRVSLGAFQGCAIADDATVHCWGLGLSNTPTLVSGVEAIDVSVGFGFTCVLTTAREVQCWGDNFNGQLGNGTSGFTPTSPPGTSVGLSDVDDIEAGDAHACARRGDELWCWGFNEHAQLGAGHRGTTDTPVPVLAP